MSNRLDITEARFRAKGWWHALFHLNVIGLIWRDLLRRIGLAHRRAHNAAHLDLTAASIIREAMSDGICEKDRDALLEALKHIDLSAHHDSRLSADLKLKA